MSKTLLEGSITHCITLLKRGDRDAAQLIWERYFHRLMALARPRLRAAPRGSGDEEDVALGVIDSFCRRAEGGRFRQLENRDDLWQLLFVLTVRKAANLVKHELCPSHRAGFLSDLEGTGFETIIGDEPTPELAVLVADQCRWLLDLLEDGTLRRVAVWKMEGYTNAEIAEKLGCVVQTVERKLRLIRQLWTAEGIGPRAG